MYDVFTWIMLRKNNQFSEFSLAPTVCLAVSNNEQIEIDCWCNKDKIASILNLPTLKMYGTIRRLCQFQLSQSKP